MKIKIDFITNSSSTSFVVFGTSEKSVKISDDFYLMVFQKYLANVEKSIVEGHNLNYWQRIFTDGVNCITDEEKIEFIKDYLDIHAMIDDYTDFSYGGEYDKSIGISMQKIMRENPELKLGQVYEFVANKMNETFGTNLSSSDVYFIADSWYDV